jgi:hypothetical protein
VSKIGPILLLLIAVSPAQAQPHFWRSKRFWIGVAVVGAAAAADGISTQKCLNRNAGCEEANPVFGVKPSVARTFGEGALLGLSFRWASYKFLPPQKDYIALGSFAAVETVVTTHNIQTK